jgi:hypothetical protein
MIETHQSGNSGNGSYPTTLEATRRRAPACLVGPAGPGDLSSGGPGDDQPSRLQRLGRVTLSIPKKGTSF